MARRPITDPHPTPRCLPLLALALSLAACGGGASPGDDGGVDPAPDAPADGVDGTGSDTTGTAPPGTGAPGPGTDPRADDGAGSAPEPAPTEEGASSGDPGPTPAPPEDGGGVPDPVPGELLGGTLSPLPSPPLTPPPDAADEPRPAAESYHTAIGFPLVDDVPRPPTQPRERITDEEFDAGLPEPVLQAPPGLDLEENRPPFFPDLDNVVVLAGQTMELHLAPIDPDGGVAGQYTEGLPAAARYIDNFDTTRSVLWRPLEPDVGIHELTVYTVDPEEPALRVRYTVLVKVVMPSDPSTIENRPPGIDRVPPQIVRVGDPVVVGIKGTDPNGTVPTLEVSGAPADATLVVDPEDERIRVLRFVPDRAGTFVLDVLARDAREPTLTHSKSIIVRARPAESFAREGTRLRELAEARDFLVGYASRSRFANRADGALYAAIAGEEFNVVTAENAMKWDALNPEPGVYRWAEADNLVAFARAKDMIVHGHTLVWYAQLPYWVKEAPPARREGHMREHIDRVLARYADDVPLWDVVNEALDEDGGLRDSIWLEAMGPAYIDIAFRQARASAPEATLLYNDYDIGFAGPKAEGLFRLLDAFEAADTPLDGVGFQMHVDADYDDFDELAAHFRRVAERDLDVYITELDVSLNEGDTEADQARVYEGVLSTCLAEPRCRALQSWGFTDRYSWREAREPLILDRDYAPKPAYRALQRRLGEN